MSEIKQELFVLREPLEAIEIEHAGLEYGNFILHPKDTNKRPIVVPYQSGKDVIHTRKGYWIPHARAWVGKDAFEEQYVSVDGEETKPPMDIAKEPAPEVLKGPKEPEPKEEPKAAEKKTEVKTETKVEKKDAK